MGGGTPARPVHHQRRAQGRSFGHASSPGDAAERQRQATEQGQQHVEQDRAGCGAGCRGAMEADVRNAQAVELRAASRRANRPTLNSKHRQEQEYAAHSLQARPQLPTAEPHGIAANCLASVAGTACSQARSSGGCSGSRTICLSRRGAQAVGAHQQLALGELRVIDWASTALSSRLRRSAPRCGWRAAPAAVRARPGRPRRRSASRRSGVGGRDGGYSRCLLISNWYRRMSAIWSARPASVVGRAAPSAARAGCARAGRCPEARRSARRSAWCCG